MSVQRSRVAWMGSTGRSRRLYRLVLIENDQGGRGFHAVLESSDREDATGAPLWHDARNAHPTGVPAQVVADLIVSILEQIAAERLASVDESASALDSLLLLSRTAKGDLADVQAQREAYLNRLRGGNPTSLAPPERRVVDELTVARPIDQPDV